MNEVEQTARASYGKLLAILIKYTSGDISVAEDCLSSAFLKALEVWPETSVPQNPEAWLVATAKNLVLDRHRHLKVQDKKQVDLIDQLEQNLSQTRNQDYRLELLFVCSHPAIDENIRTPLMLQTVMGFTVAEISRLFLLSPATLEKRLTRAKQKIKLARIPFETPDSSELPNRIFDVLETIYGVYSKSWDELNQDLEEEAVFLAELTSQSLPEQAEAMGLLSLLYFYKSRKSERRKAGIYVPLLDQNPKMWDHDSIQKAEDLLARAFQKKEIGRFQLEAAIQSAQVANILNGVDSSESLISLYRALINLTDSVGAKVSFAAALMRLNKINESQKLVLELEELGGVQEYQPFWVLKAELSLVKNDLKSAKDQFQVAIGLSTDIAIKNFLTDKINKIGA